MHMSMCECVCVLVHVCVPVHVYLVYGYVFQLYCSKCDITLELKKKQKKTVPWNLYKSRNLRKEWIVADWHYMHIV